MFVLVEYLESVGGLVRVLLVECHLAKTANQYTTLKSVSELGHGFAVSIDALTIRLSKNALMAL